MESIVFKRWSNKKYAVLNSLHKVIHIGTLSLACIILQKQPVLGQSDTAAPIMFFDLEEVEALGELETEIYSPLLRQLLVIRQDQLQIASSRSIGDLLDHYPGIDIRSRGIKGVQADLNIQGGSFDQSLVLFNGIDINDPQTGHFNLDIPLSPSQIHKIEVLKGPAAKLYGINAYTGAINIISIPEDSLSFSGDAAYGQFNTYSTNAMINIPLGITRNLISASTSGSNGYRENTDYQHSNFYFQSKAGNEQINTDFMLGWNQKSFGANAFYTPKFPEQFEETSSWLAAVKFRLMKHLSGLKGDIYWRRHSDHFLLFRSNPAAYENYHLTDILGSSLGKKINSSLGVTTFELTFRHEQIFSNSLGETGIQHVKIQKSDTIRYTHFARREHLSLSAFHLYQYKRINLNIGALIYGGIKNLAAPGIYPGIDLSRSLNSSLKLFGSINRSMRLPTFTDLYYAGPQNKGNPELIPEKALTYEVGIKRHNKPIHGDLALFFRKGKETIDWIWKDSIWQTENLTELNTYGGETSVTVVPSELNASLHFIDHLRVSYSYTQISISSEKYISNYALDNLKHKLEIDLGVKLPLHLSINGNLSRQNRNGYFQYFETPLSDPVETAYSPFWLLDLNVGVGLGRIRLFIDATNLLNTTYRDIGSVIMPGRWLMGGIKFR